MFSMFEKTNQSVKADCKVRFCCDNLQPNELIKPLKNNELWNFINRGAAWGTGSESTKWQCASRAYDKKM